MAAMYNMEDTGTNGWEFTLDFTEWDTEIIAQWIGVLDDDFGDDYEERFYVQTITGQHFKRDMLGNEHWCRTELGMDPQTAKSFSAIVRQRITQYEKKHKPEPQPKQPQTQTQPKKQSKLQQGPIKSCVKLHVEDIYSVPPDLPFDTHPKPSMISMSNKFRLHGPNTIQYPPKNGPAAMAKRLKIPIELLPDFDPHDEIYGDPIITENILLKYANQLTQLSVMGYTDRDKNIRYLLRLHGDLNNIIEEYLTENVYENIYIGDRVQRGPDWKWGNQDGGKGLEGTVRGLRQWHPNDSPNIITSVIVVWDHGLYGNYRYGYKSAYDVTVIDRTIEEKQKDKLLSIGDKITRKQLKWRWGNQDGGAGYMGTIMELYASAAPFDSGALIGVLWDHQKEKFKKAAQQYMALHPHGDDEWYVSDDEKEIEGEQKHNVEESLMKLKNFKNDPHRVRRKRLKHVHKMVLDLENESEWDEPDFEELLCKPIAKYRWGLSDRNLGNAYDLMITNKKNVSDRKFLMVDDRIRKSQYFKAKRVCPPTEHSIVLKVEQLDSRRVEPNEIKGDKIYTTWSNYESYKFGCYMDDVIFYRRGGIFKNEESHIKVGDRVQRGFAWRKKYGEEDGGEGKQGTVVCLQYALKISGIIAKVKWDKTGHVNFYSWGFKNIYDLKKVN